MACGLAFARRKYLVARCTGLVCALGSGVRALLPRSRGPTLRLGRVRALRCTGAVGVQVTIGVAYRVPGVGAVLAIDGRVTHDGEILTDSERKYIICGRTPVLISGVVGKVWRSLQEHPPRSFDAFLDAVDEEETDWLAYDRRSDRLWLGAVRVAAPFAAVGTGDSLAIGALEALPIAKSLAAAQATVARVLRIVCRRHSECGGRARVLVVPRRGAIAVR